MYRQYSTTVYSFIFDMHTTNHNYGLYSDHDFNQSLQNIDKSCFLFFSSMYSSESEAIIGDMLVCLTSFLFANIYFSHKAVCFSIAPPPVFVHTSHSFIHIKLDMYSDDLRRKYRLHPSPSFSTIRTEYALL